MDLSTFCIYILDIFPSVSYIYLKIEYVKNWISNTSMVTYYFTPISSFLLLEKFSTIF